MINDNYNEIEEDIAYSERNCTLFPLIKCESPLFCTEDQAYHAYDFIVEKLLDIGKKFEGRKTFYCEECRGWHGSIIIESSNY